MGIFNSIWCTYLIWSENTVVEEGKFFKLSFDINFFQTLPDLGASSLNKRALSTELCSRLGYLKTGLWVSIVGSVWICRKGSSNKITRSWATEIIHLGLLSKQSKFMHRAMIVAQSSEVIQPMHCALHPKSNSNDYRKPRCRRWPGVTNRNYQSGSLWNLHITGTETKSQIQYVGLRSSNRPKVNVNMAPHVVLFNNIT